MKKIITVLAAACFCAAAFAQTGIGAGYANSVLKVGDSSSSYDGAYASLYASFPLSGALGVKSGVTAEYLVSDNAALWGTVNTKSTEVYLDVPVQLTFGGQVSRDLGWTLYAGPTASFGVISNTVASTTLLGGASTDPISKYGDDSNYGRFDVLVGGGIMIDFAQKFRFDAGYDYGLMNRFQNSDTKCNRAVFHVGVAYLF